MVKALYSEYHRKALSFQLGVVAFGSRQRSGGKRNRVFRPIFQHVGEHRSHTIWRGVTRQDQFLTGVVVNQKARRAEKILRILERLLLCCLP